MQEYPGRRIVEVGGQPHLGSPFRQVHWVGLQGGIVALAVVRLGVHHAIFRAPARELKAERRRGLLCRRGRKGNRQVPGASGKLSLLVDADSRRRKFC